LDRVDAQGPHEEGRHLCPGHRLIGAESRVGVRVAASGYPSRGERFDVASVDRIGYVSEARRLLGGRKFEGIDEEGGHLCPGHGLVGAITIVGRWVASLRDAGGGETLDGFAVDGGCDVAEPAAFASRDLERPGEESSHLVALDRVIRTEDRFGVVASRRYPGGGQALDRRFVDAPLVVVEGSPWRQVLLSGGRRGSQDEERECQ